MLTHTVFHFLFALFVMLINVVVVEPVCSVKHALQNTQNDCHQWLFDSSRVHQIRFRGPRWGAHGAPPDPLVGWGGGYPLPFSLPPRRLQRLGDGLYNLWSRRSVIDPPAVLIPPPNSWRSG